MIPSGAGSIPGFCQRTPPQRQQRSVTQFRDKTTNIMLYLHHEDFTCILFVFPAHDDELSDGHGHGHGHGHGLFILATYYGFSAPDKWCVQPSNSGFDSICTTQDSTQSAQKSFYYIHNYFVQIIFISTNVFVQIILISILSHSTIHKPINRCMQHLMGQCAWITVCGPSTLHLLK